MNLAAINTFLAIVETGNLNHAAERLNVTPSTVTARLNRLEREIGQTLFLRRKSGAELTSAGFKFERYAQLMSDLWRQARQESSLPPEIASVCNLGCSFDLWPVAGRRFADHVHAVAKRVALAVWPGSEDDLDKWLGSGLIDAALCTTVRLRAGWIAHELPPERLVLVATTPRQRVRSDPDYVYVDAGEDLRRAHAEAYVDADMPKTTFASTAWALDHILRHGGSAHLPEDLVAPHVRAGRLHSVPDTPVFERPRHIVTAASKTEQWPWFDGARAAITSAVHASAP